MMGVFSPSEMNYKVLFIIEINTPSIFLKKVEGTLATFYLAIFDHKMLNQ